MSKSTRQHTQGPDAVPSLAPVAGPREPTQILRIAHRSLELRGPDPIVACRAVRSEGAHLVEVDGRVTGDDQLVVAHDPWVRAPDGSRVWIADLSENQVCTLDSRVISLANALTAVSDSGLGLYLDLKSLTPPSANWLGSALVEAGLENRSVMASSRTDVVALCGRELAGLPRAVLFAPSDEDPVQLAESVHAQFVHPCWERFDAPDRLLTEPWIERVRGSDLGIVTWHEERSAVVDALVSLGVDGVCTDDMPLLSATVIARTTRSTTPEACR